jgi:hypothetical protein
MVQAVLGNKLQVLHVVHKVSGQLYDRTDQYKLLGLNQNSNGLPSYFWEGFLIKDPNVVMTGHLWQNNSVWLYDEHQGFRDGSPGKLATPPVMCQTLNSAAPPAVAATPEVEPAPSVQNREPSPPPPAAPSVQSNQRQQLGARGWLGVQVQSVTPDNANALGQGRIEGVIIVQPPAPTSPAAAAGLMVGDVITALNGQSIKADTDLSQRVASTPPGTSISLTIIRKGEAKTLSVTLGRLAEADPGDRWLQRFVTANGGCASDVFAPFHMQNVQSQLFNNKFETELFGKPILNWSDDDIATALHVFRDCHAESDAKWVAACMRMGHSQTDCEQIRRGRPDLRPVSEFEHFLRDTVTQARQR